jgi:hypothetical protein
MEDGATGRHEVRFRAKTCYSRSTQRKIMAPSELVFQAEGNNVR